MRGCVRIHAEIRTVPLDEDSGVRWRSGSICPELGNAATGWDARTAVAVRRYDYAWGVERFLEEAQALARVDRPARGACAPGVRAAGHGVSRDGVASGERTGGRGVWRTSCRRRERCRRLGCRRCRGALTTRLEPLHAVAPVHRGIKPASVMLRSGGSPVLIDFGAARQLTGRRPLALGDVGVDVGVRPD